MAKKPRQKKETPKPPPVRTGSAGEDHGSEAESGMSQISESEGARLKDMLDEKVKLDGRDAKILFKWLIPNTLSSAGSPKFKQPESPPRPSPRTYPPATKSLRRKESPTVRTARSPRKSNETGEDWARDEDDEPEITLYDVLFYNLHSAMDELYLACEIEDETSQQVNQCEEAIRVMQQSTEDFRALIRRFQVERRVDEAPPGIQTSGVAWEVRKKTGSSTVGIRRTPLSSPGTLVISSPMIAAPGEDEDGWMVATSKNQRQLDYAAPAFKPKTPEMEGKIGGFIPPCPPLQFIPKPMLNPDKVARTTPRMGSGSDDEHDSHLRCTLSGSEDGYEYGRSPGSRPRTWAEVCNWRKESAMRNKEIHERLSSMERKSPITKSSLEERHARAQQRREQAQQEKELRLKEQNEHAAQVAAANKERKEKQQAEQGRRHASAAARHVAHVQEKMHKAVSENKKVHQVITDVAASQNERRERLKRRHASAAAQRDAHLQDKVHKAVNENKKVDEIMFIENLSKKNDEIEREQNLRRRIQESEDRRAMYLASVRQRALQISTKEEKVAERKRLLELERTSKIEQAEQRRLAARARKASMTPPPVQHPSSTSRLRHPAENDVLQRRNALAIEKSKRREEAEERRSNALLAKQDKATAVAAKVEAARARHRGTAEEDGAKRDGSKTPTQNSSKSSAAPCPSQNHLGVMSPEFNKAKAKKCKRAKAALLAALSKLPSNMETAAGEDDETPMSPKLPSSLQDLSTLLEKISIEGLESSLQEILDLPDPSTVSSPEFRRSGGLHKVLSLCNREVIKFPSQHLLHLAIKVVHTALAGGTDSSTYLLQTTDTIVLFHLLTHHKPTDDASTVFGGHLCSVLSSVLRSEVSDPSRLQARDCFVNWAVHSGAFGALLNCTINLSLACFHEDRRKLCGLHAPTSLHQALWLLETLTSSHGHDIIPVWMHSKAGGSVAEWFATHGYMAMLKVLGALILENKTLKSQSTRKVPGHSIAPVELLELLVLAMRTLNNLAALDLPGMQVLPTS
eukprot:TRINITY_DN5277_c0_g1_i5.p1 TRINITY_DN5277_c0_g1~~TRINITY_DN5277_c0_g1_i5.p1  ORF type:complete len:1029 (-),score=288.98 TRINITY_DN5277_c0_g1_i5:903-3989(-)